MSAKLTKPQFELLAELERSFMYRMHCVSVYKPAQKLVQLGFAIWERDDHLEATSLGIRTLATLMDEKP